MRLVLPRLYVILDSGLITTSNLAFIEEMADAGVRLLQYRNKKTTSARLLRDSCELGEASARRGMTFLVNDRADVALLANADGVHLGQDDLPVESARKILGPEKWIGVSTHNVEQFRRAVETSADYIAFGPAFSTTSKDNPDPVVGTEMLRQVRGLTNKPIVAIGGITVERAREVIEAGADSVAVISDIMTAEHPGTRAKEFLETLAAVNPGRRMGANKE
jgi:thiamine-phosphate pyrophosphorylase